MSVDLASIDEALEQLRGDQVAVGRAMLAAGEWADAGRLSAIDEALEALSEGAVVPVQVGGSLPIESTPPEATAASGSESGGGLDGLFDELEGMEDPFAPDSERADAATNAGDEDDDLLELDELEILEDDDLLTVD